MTRRLAAILAADAANFSRLVAQAEERTLQVLAGHRSVIDSTIGMHGGRIVTTAGDSVLAEFSSPVQAVRAAIEIQRALKIRNAEVGLASPLLFRIGVNVGDVVVDGENILGDGVNVAVRLENLAPPGGICISASVRDHVAGKLDGRLQDLGSQYLKNIPRPVRVYQVISESKGPESMLQRVKQASWKLLGASLALVLLGFGAWFSAIHLPVEGRMEPRGKAPVRLAAPASEEHAFWDSVKGASDPAELRAYIDKYPDGTFVELAQARLDGLLAARARRSEEDEARAKATEASRAQAEAVRLKSEAEAAIARAEAEQATASRLRAEAEAAAARAVSATRAATEAHQKLARSPGATVNTSAERITLVRAASPLDGRWTADWTCEASAEQPASSLRLPAQIQFREIRIESGQVGLPGYFRAYGSIAEDGSFQLMGTSLPRTQRIVGIEDAMQVSGRVDGERLEGNGSIGKRRCSLALSRVAVQ